jgi:hypothetical protein
MHCDSLRLNMRWSAIFSIQAAGGNEKLCSLLFEDIE